MPIIDESQLDPLPSRPPAWQVAEGFDFDNAPRGTPAPAPTAPMRGRFITEDELDPITPSIFEDPLGAITSPDWWLTRPSGERISAGQAVAGPVLSALDGLTLNSGDEIAAGGNAVLDAFMGEDIGDAYDKRLEAARGAESSYREASPGMSFVTDLAGGLKLPFMPKPAKTAMGRIGKTAGTAAVLGAGYGFGDSEGGFEKRSEDAAKSAVLSALMGGGLQGGAEVVGSLAKNLPLWSKAFDRKSIGTRYGDYQKTANDLGLIELPDGDLQTKTKIIVDDLLSNNKLGQSRDPAALVAKAKENEKDLATRIARIVEEFDDAVGAPVTPTFDQARRYIAEGRIPADKIDNYINRLENLEQGIRDNGRGKLAYIQQQKIAHGKLWDPNDTTLNGFNRAIYSDLERTISDATPGVVPLNQELQKYKIVRPILDRTLATTEGKEPVSRFIQAIRTSGGGGVPVIAGAAMGGLPGFIGGAAFSGALAAATSPSGKQKIAQGLAKAGKTLSKLPKASDFPLQTLGLAASRGVSPTGTQENEQPGVKSNSLKFRMQESESYPISSTKSSPNFIRNAIEKADAMVEEKSKGLKKPVILEAKRVGEAKPGKPTADIDLDTLTDNVILTESNGNPNAVSAAGAKGLGQLMDATGQEWHKKLNIKEPYDPFNPKQNKTISKAYLGWLVNQFDGNKELALAAYNGGIGRVRKAVSLARHLGDKDPDFETIKKYLPKETREYVPKVLGKQNNKVVLV